MSWRILYIENSHKVSLYLNNLKIEDGDESYVVPIADINTVIFNNYKMYMTAQLLCKLSQANVCVIICEKNGLPEVVLNPLNGSYVTFRNQELQMNLSQERRSELWQYLIKTKIANQLAVLTDMGKDGAVYNKLKQFQDEVLAGDESNREGLAAKMYFRALFGKEFIREPKADDALNQSLNYGYGLLRAMMARSVAAKGFIPSPGIFHRNPYNHFNLVDDFLEVYRPLIDRWVVENMISQYFVREKRLQLVEYTSKKVLIGEKEYAIMQSMDIYLDGMVSYMKTGDALNLKMPGFMVFDNDG